MGEISIKRKGSPSKTVVCANTNEIEQSNSSKVKKQKQNRDDTAREKCGTAKAIESHLKSYEPIKVKLFARALWNRLSMKESAGNCEICDTGCERLQVTHLWDCHSKESLIEAYFKDIKHMPPDVGDVMNGLLLCPGCHSEFDGEERRLNISPNGTIVATGFVFDTFRKELHNKKVPWADEIDRNRHYPSSALLRAVFSRPRLSRKYDREREHQLRDELLYEVYSGSAVGDCDRVVLEGSLLQVDWDKPLDSDGKNIVCGVVGCNHHCIFAARGAGNLPLCYQHASASSC